jgi:DNA-binding FadR family transcriptional regulator
MKFKKAKQNRIFQDIVDQIEEVILDGAIQPGERLPAERDLCAQFKASRGTLREALRILEQKGLIEIRLGAGGGAFVRKINSDLMTTNLAILIRSGRASADHLVQLLEESEATVAALAAKKATAPDVVLLKKLVLQAQEHKDDQAEGREQFMEIDQAIQQEIYRIADNPLYIFLLQSIRDNLEPANNQGKNGKADGFEQRFQNLRMMVYAIGRNDQALAARQAREHVRNFSAA